MGPLQLSFAPLAQTSGYATGWEEVLLDVLQAIRSFLCLVTNETPHERLFCFSRKAMMDTSLPSWLLNPGPVLLRFVRNKSDPCAILYSCLKQIKSILWFGMLIAEKVPFIRQIWFRRTSLPRQRLTPRWCLWDDWLEYGAPDRYGECAGTL